ncbi:MAG: MFS transporter [Actinobacteria bacterium]|nr:MFS transporter [Actinomycetota bacterium]
MAHDQQIAAPATGARDPVRVTGSLALAAGLLLIALNLRIGVAAVGPVLGDIRASTGLPAAGASLLTTIPVLAFGGFAFVIPGLIARLGMYRVLGVAMAVLAIGVVIRLLAGPVPLFGGTVLIGAAIAVANVLLPAVIKQDFAGRTALMMGLYTTALYAGASLAAGLTVPLVGWTGGHWRPAMALWAIPAAAAFVVWLPWARRSAGRRGAAGKAGTAGASPGAQPGAGEPSLRALVRDRTALAVMIFMGVQSLGYYATLTWIPTLLQNAGLSAHQAGWMVSYSSFAAIAAALTIPTLGRRLRPSWTTAAITVALPAGAYLGLIVAPAGPVYLWMTLLGLGQGAGISLALSYIVWRSPDTRHTAHLSTMAQGFGYLLASLGPIGFGVLHSATGGWTWPLIALLALLAVQLGAGAAASRDRPVPAPRVSGGPRPG